MTISPKVQEHIKSAVITFTTGVALVVLPQITTLSLDSIENGALAGLLLAGVRMGIKMLADLIITWISPKELDINK